MSLLIIIGLLVDWIIRIGALFVVPRNRKPSSATAWLMLILLLPFIGLIIFLLIGSPKLNKRRRSMQKQMDDIIVRTLNSGDIKNLIKKVNQKKLPEDLLHISQLNENLGGFPVLYGNKFEVLDDYDKIIAAIANDIKNSKKYVHIEFFIIAMDQTTEIIFKELEAAVNRGVKVRLLFDTLGSRKYPKFKNMKKRLTEIGVEWYPMLPLTVPGKNFNRPDLRNHRKIVVVDGKFGYTGSLNLITRNYHRKDELYYDELVARIQGPVVLELQAAFITDWYSETGVILDRSKYPELIFMPTSEGDILSQVLPSGPGFNNDNNLKLFTALIHSAQHEITIVNPYFVPDDSLINAITSASLRGVQVTLVNSKIIDQPMVGYAQRSYFEELLKAGVNIYQYKTPILLHSKYMTIDEKVAVIGSSNMDIRSFQLNLEVTVIAYDKGVVASLEKITKTYLYRSNMLKIENWNKRSLRKKLYENLARLTSAIQ